LSAYENEWSYFDNFVNSLTDTTYYTGVKCYNAPYTDANFPTPIHSAGTYYASITIGSGCDSVVCLTLTEINPTVSGLGIANVDNSFVIHWFNSPELVYEIYRDDIFLDTVSSSARTGTYIDSNLVDGTTYCYKIKAIDGNCESDFSDTICQMYTNVGIIETCQGINLRVYPNPTNGQLIIESGELAIENAEYRIFSIIGQLIMQGKLQETSIINIESLASGMYYLRIGKNMVKFVKE
jgi:hypothetical protein